MTTNRRGKPPLDATDRSVSVHLVLPSRLYDKSYAAARDARQSVNEWIRDRIRDGIRPPRRTEN